MYKHRIKSVNVFFPPVHLPPSCMIAVRHEVRNIWRKLFRFLHLPPLDQENIAQFANESLGDEFGQPVADVMAVGLEPNPRKIKRGLDIFRLLWLLATERGLVEPMDGNQALEPDLLAKIVVIQNRWRDLYNHVVRYPNLLANLEDHFERQRQAEEEPIPGKAVSMRPHAMWARTSAIPHQ